MIRLLLLAALSSPIPARAAAPGNATPRTPANGAAPIDLRLSDAPETIRVEGRRRFVAAPVPGHRSDAGPSATAIFDPKTGASVGEFGWAYVLAAP